MTESLEQIDYDLLQQLQKQSQDSIFHQGIGKGGGKTIYSRNVSADEITTKDIENLNFQNANIQNYNRIRNDQVELIKVFQLISKSKINTLKQLENYLYGGSLTKTMTTTSTDMLNNLYGKNAWDQVNREHTLFALLRKKIWRRSGWRLITPEAADEEQYTREDGTIGAAEQPTFKKLKVDPSSIMRRTTETDILNILSSIEDGVDESTKIEWLDQRHKQIINYALLRANENEHNNIGIWSIDRIIASYAEYAYGNIANSAAITADYLTVYGLTRPSATYADAVVSGQAYGSGDRALNLTQLRTMIRQVRTLHGRINTSDYVILTHPETAQHIDELAANSQRYNDSVASTYIRGGRGGMQVLGAEPREGVEGSLKVATWEGIPIFDDPGVVQDTIGRIYLINLDLLFFGVLLPTRFYRWQGPESTSSFNIERLYRTVGNTVCRKFRSCGKIRDLANP